MPKVRERYHAGSPSREELLKIQRALKRVVIGLGNVAVSATVGIGDLTTLTLTGNAALTLDIDSVMAGDSGFLEVAQDGVGGRVPTWVNATGSAGAVTAPAAGVNVKTMYHCVYNGTTWVLSVHASSY